MKRSLFEAAGCPSYWVVDPDEPSIIVWQLQGEEYVEAAHVSGEERVDLQAPYSVTIIPAELVD